MIDDVQIAITHKVNILDYCKTVPLEAVVANEYDLSPSRYVQYESKETERRSYKEIHHDLLRVLSVKNAVKITCNETIAKSIGLVNTCELKCDPVEHVGGLLKQNTEKEGTFGSIISIIGCEPLPRDNHLTFSKNKNEIKIENKGDGVDILIADFLRFWSIRIRELNTEENTYLAELCDKLLAYLMLVTSKYRRSILCLCV